MTRVVLPLVEQTGGEATPRAALGCVYSAGGWALVAVPVLLHEAAHVAAASALGLRFRGAGARVTRHGRLGPLPLLRARGFFVMHDPADDFRDPLVSLAPAALLPVAVALDAAGVHWLVWVHFLIGGLAVASDIVVKTCESAGVDPFEGSDAEYVVLLGGPDLWQTELGRYA